MTNAEIVARLRAEAAELSRIHGNLYRVRALRQAALAVSGLPRPVADLQPEDLRLAGLGKSLSQKVMMWATATVERTDPVRC